LDEAARKEAERLRVLNRIRVAEFRDRQRGMAQLGTQTIAPLLAWMQSPDRKQGDEVEVTATIVQTPEKYFYQLISIGNAEKVVDELKARNSQSIVHILPVRFKLSVSKVEG
jgi:hypothetical protein